MTAHHPAGVTAFILPGRGTLTRAAVMLPAITGPPIEHRPADVASADPLVPRLERALRRFRLQSAHNLLDEALATRSPAAFLREVAWPVLDRLDDPAPARLAASMFEQRLLVHARGWQAVRGPLVVLACAPRDDGVLALIGLGIELAERHCRISYLGAATPAAALRDAARAQAACAVVLSAAEADLSAHERGELQALARELPLLVIGAARAEVAAVAGAIAVDGPASAARVARAAERESSRRGDEASPS